MTHCICENSRCQRQWDNGKHWPSHYCNDACMKEAHGQLTRGHSVLSEPLPLPSPRATRTIAQAARELAAQGDCYGESRREADTMLVALTGRPSHVTALENRRKDLTNYEQRKM